MVELLKYILAAAMAIAAFASGCLAQTVREATVGEPVCFTLAAVDANGDTIRDWDRTGKTVWLQLHNSTANSDTSLQSWNGYPDGYTWAKILHDGVELGRWSASEWMLEPAAFVNGSTTLCLVHTKAERDVSLLALPGTESIHTPDIRTTFLPAPFEELFADVTWPRRGEYAVYVYRPFELYIAARDMYTNVIADTVQVRLAAHFPHELEYAGAYFERPGGEFPIVGETAIWLYGLEARLPGAEPQVLRVSSLPDTQRTVVAGAFAVLPHPPSEFSLIAPDWGDRVLLEDEDGEALFIWEGSKDDYQDMRVSRFHEKHISDTVRYELRFANLSGETRYIVPAQNSGRSNIFVMRHSLLDNIAQVINHGPVTTRRFDMHWYIAATDGHSERNNRAEPDPAGQPYRLLRLDYSRRTFFHRVTEQATDVSIVSSYPNPFTGSANVQFTVPVDGHATMLLYDNTGRMVATLLDGFIETGTYISNFISDGLAAGTYYLVLTQGANTARQSVVKVR